MSKLTQAIVLSYLAEHYEVGQWVDTDILIDWVRATNLNVHHPAKALGIVLSRYAYNQGLVDRREGDFGITEYALTDLGYEYAVENLRTEYVNVMPPVIVEPIILSEDEDETVGLSRRTTSDEEDDSSAADVIRNLNLIGPLEQINRFKSVVIHKADRAPLRYEIPGNVKSLVILYSNTGPENAPDYLQWFGRPLAWFQNLETLEIRFDDERAPELHTPKAEWTVILSWE